MVPRIILLEDDELVRISLTRALKRKGYEVVCSSDPTICPILQSLQKQLPPNESFGDFLLTDNNMPVLNGLELVELQTQNGCLGKIPHKAIMSACWEDDAVVKARQLGCKVFHKPLDIKEILAWLETGKKTLNPHRKLVSLE